MVSWRYDQLHAELIVQRQQDNMRTCKVEMTMGNVSEYIEKNVCFVSMIGVTSVLRSRSKAAIAYRPDITEMTPVH